MLHPVYSTLNFLFNVVVSRAVVAAKQLLCFESVWKHLGGQQTNCKQDKQDNGIKHPASAVSAKN